MTDPLLQLQVLLRSEVALVRLQARRAAAQTKVLAAAYAFAFLALIMLNLAAYQQLAPGLGFTGAALLVAAVDLVIALLFAAASRNAGPGPEEEKAVNEVRDMAYRELSAAVEDVRTDMTRITEDVRRIRSNFGRVGEGLAPVVGLLAGAIKKGRKKS